MDHGLETFAFLFFTFLLDHRIPKKACEVVKITAPRAACHGKSFFERNTLIPINKPRVGALMGRKCLAYV